MVRKLSAHLATSLILILLVTFNNAEARTLTIKGRVHFDDGKPIDGATVVLTQLHGVFWSKPRPLGVAVTGRDGAFVAEIENAKGTVDVELVEDRCSWSTDVVQINVASVEKNKEVTVELVPRRDICNSKSTEP